MGRHYSTTDFFRKMPNALLARYFQARGLFGDLDFSAMKESQPDEMSADSRTARTEATLLISPTASPNAAFHPY